MNNPDFTSVLAPSFLPATCVLELGYKCNHVCKFCSCPWEAPNSKFTKFKELSLDEWKYIIRKMTEMGVCTFAFSGGEPLLNKHLPELLSFTASQSATYIETVNDQLETWQAPPKMFLISNGTLMNQQILDICAKHNIHLSMSMPGIKTFQYHTGTKHNPETILRWFEKTKEMNIATNVNITVTKKNLHELYENVSLPLIAGANSLLMNRFLPGGRGLKYTNELMLSTDEVNEMLRITEDVLSKANRKGNLGTELPLCIIKETTYEKLQIGTNCSAAIDFFVIDPSGYIRVCNHSPVRLHHYTEVEKVKSHPYWKKFVMKDYHPGYCTSCKLKFNCDAGCRECASIVYGKTDALDPIMNAHKGV